ncbi:hypothetical protein [Neorhizobium sp. P12A]|uniref:hypothetical protein n=1 Tax=Neorhizobium sp. P12A TaxID=2268027 RepID=UPI0011EE70EC|nr:hypothetical protein [Neorhizobium sp. P12A]
MPFFKVTTHAMLIEADDALEAAMTAYRRYDDRSPHQFDVVGPDELQQTIALTAQEEEEAITIEFGRKIESRKKR